MIIVVEDAKVHTMNPDVSLVIDYCLIHLVQLYRYGSYLSVSHDADKVLHMLDNFFS